MLHDLGYPPATKVEFGGDGGWHEGDLTYSLTAMNSLKMTKMRFTLPRTASTTAPTTTAPSPYDIIMNTAKTGAQPTALEAFPNPQSWGEIDCCNQLISKYEIKVALSLHKTHLAPLMKLVGGVLHGLDGLGNVLDGQNEETSLLYQFRGSNKAIRERRTRDIPRLSQKLLEMSLKNVGGALESPYLKKNSSLFGACRDLFKSIEDKKEEMAEKLLQSGLQHARTLPAKIPFMDSTTQIVEGSTTSEVLPALNESFISHVARHSC